jgi:hypothetical protein
VGKRIIINKVSILIGIAQMAFMVNGQPFSDTSYPPAKSSILISVNAINEDTLSLEKNALKNDPVTTNVEKDSAIIDLRQRTQSIFLQEAIAKGKRLTTTGMVLHFAAFGLESFLTLGSMWVMSPDASKIILAGMLVMAGTQMVSPIVSCKGASTVKNAAESAGIKTGAFLPWKDYGRGWAYTGIGTGLVTGGLLLASGLTDRDKSGRLYTAIPIFFTGVGFIIAGEVKWVQCLVHAKIYAKQFDENPQKKSISYNITPYLNIKGRAGLILSARF